MPGVVGFIILAIIVVVVVRCICIVPQASQWIVEILGKYYATWDAGLHLRIPFISRVAKKVSLKEQVADFEPQSVITKDNVGMRVDSVVFFQIFDAKLFTYGVERPVAAIENLAATTLRNIIGSMTLDETLTSRDEINASITGVLDQATDKWGIKVNRVEVKDIQPPATIREAMEKQMRAEREKREKILTAEGEKQSQITLAEGEKEAAILRADAVKERTIREAEGEARALLAIQEARAKGIAMINQANPSAQYLQLEQYEAAKIMADGKATKLIIPSEIANLGGTIASISEMAKLSTPTQPVQPRPQQQTQIPQQAPQNRGVVQPRPSANQRPNQ